MNTVTIATILLQVTENGENRENVKLIAFHGFASNFALWCNMVVARWQECKNAYMWRHVTDDVITCYAIIA